MYAASYRTHRLTFDVAGVWRRNLILADRETGTLWQQATGIALIGPLEGERLRPLPVTLVTHAAWRAERPSGEVVTSVAWAGALPVAATGWLLHRLDPLFRARGLTAQDRRLSPTAEVIGVELGAHARAYPLARLRQETVIHDFFRGSALLLVYEPSADRASVFVRPYEALRVRIDGEPAGMVSDDGQHRWRVDGHPLTPAAPPLTPLPFSRLYWAGWYEFHPQTTTYPPERPRP